MARVQITPKSYYDETIGKSIDTDNYPRSNKYQCWDYFDNFCRKVDFEGSRYCASTGYVGDLWLLRDAQGYEYSRDFEYITDPVQFRDGDWIFWKSHVAMYYNGKEVGQITGSIDWEDQDVVDYMMKLKKEISEKLEQSEAADQQD
jgi:hypothetical protein